MEPALLSGRPPARPCGRFAPVPLRAAGAPGAGRAAAPGGGGAGTARAGGAPVGELVRRSGRVALLVGLASVVFAIVLGVSLGLVAGYAGGKVDAFIMRVADVQLSFPAILIALLLFRPNGILGSSEREKI